MVTRYQGTVHDGQIRLDDDQALPEGAQVIVMVVTDGDPEEIRGITGQELLESGLIGLWADRDDITDSAEFARNLRERHRAGE